MGTKGKIQIKNAWYTPDNKGVCAIGALMLLHAPARLVSGDFYAEFPDLQVLLPNNNFLLNEVKDRNDRGDTFDQIIEWLQSIGY